MRYGFKGNVLKAISYLNKAIEFAEDKMKTYINSIEEAKIVSDEEREYFCQMKYEKWQLRKENLEDIKSEIEDLAGE